MTDSKTATERLREMLDARGVEWRDSEPYGANAVTKFDVRGITLRYIEYPDYCWFDYNENETLTPEQAIAATLGSGECEFELNTDMTAICCDKCGYELPAGTNLGTMRYCGGCGKAVKR